MNRFFKSKLIFVLIVTALLFGATVTLSKIVPARAVDTGGYHDYNMPCEHSPYAASGPGYWCKNYDWGPVHTAKYDDPSEISSRGYAYRNCTDFVAWKVASLNVSPAQYKGLGNAKQWPTYAPGKGLTVNTTPALGAAAVDIRGYFGHVAFISAYNSATGVITVQEYNKYQDGNYDTRTGTPADLGFTQVVHFEKYEINGSSSSVATYAGKIVQWNGDTKAQKTSWLVSPELKRYWIPDSSTFNCLTNQGFASVPPISSTLLDQLPDQTGQWARCGNNSLGANQFLFRGSYLKSNNERYTLQLQRSDGNLVLYGPSGALWANSRSSDFLVMQGDNNLVTYRAGGVATWDTGTSNTGANTLVVQDDGNLVLYASGGVPIWDRYHGRLR